MKKGPPPVLFSSGRQATSTRRRRQSRTPKTIRYQPDVHLILYNDVVSIRRCLVLAGRQNYTRHEVHSHVQTARPVAEAGAVHTEVDTHAGSNADATLET